MNKKTVNNIEIIKGNQVISIIDDIEVKDVFFKKCNYVRFVNSYNYNDNFKDDMFSIIPCFNFCYGFLDDIRSIYKISKIEIVDNKTIIDLVEVKA